MVMVFVDELFNEKLLKYLQYVSVTTLTLSYALISTSESVGFICVELEVPICLFKLLAIGYSYILSYAPSECIDAGVDAGGPRHSTRCNTTWCHEVLDPEEIVVIVIHHHYNQVLRL